MVKNSQMHLLSPSLKALKFRDLCIDARIHKKYPRKTNDADADQIDTIRGIQYTKLL